MSKKQFKAIAEILKNQRENSKYSVFPQDEATVNRTVNNIAKKLCTVFLESNGDFNESKFIEAIFSK